MSTLTLALCACVETLRFCRNRVHSRRNRAEQIAPAAVGSRIEHESFLLVGQDDGGARHHRAGGVSQFAADCSEVGLAEKQGRQHERQANQNQPSTMTTRNVYP